MDHLAVLTIFFLLWTICSADNAPSSSPKTKRETAILAIVKHHRGRIPRRPITPNVKVIKAPPSKHVHNGPFYINHYFLCDNSEHIQPKPEFPRHEEVHVHLPKNNFKLAIDAANHNKPAYFYPLVPSKPVDFGDSFDYSGQKTHAPITLLPPHHERPFGFEGGLHHSHLPGDQKSTHQFDHGDSFDHSEDESIKLHPSDHLPLNEDFGDNLDYFGQKSHEFVTLHQKSKDHTLIEPSDHKPYFNHNLGDSDPFNLGTQHQDHGALNHDLGLTSHLDSEQLDLSVRGHDSHSHDLDLTSHLNTDEHLDLSSLQGDIEHINNNNHHGIDLSGHSDVGTEHNFDITTHNVGLDSKNIDYSFDNAENHQDSVDSTAAPEHNDDGNTERQEAKLVGKTGVFNHPLDYGHTQATYNTPGARDSYGTPVKRQNIPVQAHQNQKPGNRGSKVEDYFNVDLGEEIRNENSLTENLRFERHLRTGNRTNSLEDSRKKSSGTDQPTKRRNVKINQSISGTATPFPTQPTINTKRVTNFVGNKKNLTELVHKMRLGRNLRKIHSTTPRTERENGSKNETWHSNHRYNI